MSVLTFDRPNSTAGEGHGFRLRALAIALALASPTLAARHVADFPAPGNVADIAFPITSFAPYSAQRQALARAWMTRRGQKPGLRTAPTSAWSPLRLPVTTDTNQIAICTPTKPVTLQSYSVD